MGYSPNPNCDLKGYFGVIFGPKWSNFELIQAQSYNIPKDKYCMEKQFRRPFKYSGRGHLTILTINVIQGHSDPKLQFKLIGISPCKI